MKLLFKLNNPNQSKVRAEDFEIFKRDVKEFVVEETNDSFAIEIRQSKLIEFIENQLNEYIEDMRACMDCKQIIKVSEPCACYDLEAYCFQEINTGDFEFKDLNENVQSRIREDAQDWLYNNTSALDCWKYDILQIFFQEEWGPAIHLVRIEYF